VIGPRRWSRPGAEAAGDITVMRAAERDFLCPIQP